MRPQPVPTEDETHALLRHHATALLEAAKQLQERSWYPNINEVQIEAALRGIKWHRDRYEQLWETRPA